MADNEQEAEDFSRIRRSLKSRGVNKPSSFGLKRDLAETIRFLIELSQPCKDCPRDGHPREFD